MSIFNSRWSERSDAHLLFLFVITTITALVYFPYLDLAPLVNEETRRAIVAKELIERDNYFIATIAGESYTAKPLLFNWLIIAASSLTDGNITEWSARLPSVLGSIVLVISMYWFTRHWWSWLSRLFFVVILAFSPQIIRKTTSAEIDLVFACLVNLSLFSWFHYYQQKQETKAWLLSAVFIALAYLCKREAALLFYFLSIAGYLIYSKNSKQLASAGFFAAILIILAGVSLWLAPILSKYGLQVFVEQTANEINARSSDSGIGNYLFTSAIYPLEVFIALLPAGLLLIALFFKNNRRLLAQHYGEKFHFLLFIVLLNLIPFILLGKSNVRYYLPMFVPAFMLATMVFSQWQHLTVSTRIKNIISFYIPALILALLTLACTVIYFTKPLPGNSSYVLPVLAVASSIYLFVFIRANITNQRKSLFLVFCLAIGILVRIFDLGYSQPRVKENTEQLRNIPKMLLELEQIKRIENKEIVASPKISHGLYFYDDNKVVKPLNCKQTVQSNYLILEMVKNKVFKNTLPVTLKERIVWQSTYKKDKTIFLYQPENIGQPADYCANQSLGVK